MEMGNYLCFSCYKIQFLILSQFRLFWSRHSKQKNKIEARITTYLGRAKVTLQNQTINKLNSNKPEEL